jgi:hypothetical protein
MRRAFVQDSSRRARDVDRHQHNGASEVAFTLVAFEAWQTKADGFIAPWRGQFDSSERGCELARGVRELR